MPDLSLIELIGFSLVSIAHTLIHPVGLRITFPSPWNHKLWMFASYTICATTAIYWISKYLEQLVEVLHSRPLNSHLRVREYRHLAGLNEELPVGTTRTDRRLFNRLDLSWGDNAFFNFFHLLLWYVLGIAYVAARVCILIEALLSLRQQDSSVYRAISWSQYLPHIGH